MAFDCLADGTIVPITVNGVVKDASAAIPACDRPPLLGFGNALPKNGGQGQCIPYSRLLRKNNGDVVSLAFCRRYELAPMNNPMFQDINVIRYNKTNNKVCWYNSKLPAAKDGTAVPRPYFAGMTEAQKNKVRDFWSKPSEIKLINCTRCHDSDVWIHSPYVRQLSGAAVAVPVDPGHKDLVQVGWLVGQMSVPRRMHFNGDVFSAEFPKAKADAGKKLMHPGRCTECHRIGEFTTCASFAPQSMHSRKNPGGADLRDLLNYVYRPAGPDILTHRTHWMPEASFPGGVTSASAYEEHFKRAKKALEECCRNPDLTHVYPAGKNPDGTIRPEEKAKVCPYNALTGEVATVTTLFTVIVRGSGLVTMTPSLETDDEDLLDLGFGGTSWTCPLDGDPYATSDGEGRTQYTELDGPNVVSVTCYEPNQFTELEGAAVSGFIPRYRIDATPAATFTGFGDACGGTEPCIQEIWTSRAVSAYFSPNVPDTFGGEETGGLPPPEFEACASGAAKAAAKLARSISNCHVKRAKGTLADAAAEEACEDAAKTRFDGAVAALSGCPVCLDAASLRNTIEQLLDQVNGFVFCEPGAPFGGDDAGFIPPDQDAARCETKIAKAIGKLAQKILNCHRKRGMGKLATANDTQLCETKELDKFNRAVRSDCPPCALDNAWIARAEVEAVLDASNHFIYCGTASALGP